MDFDIDAEANGINELFRGRQGSEALALLERRREGQPTAVVEALDRYVATTALDYFGSIGRSPSIPDRRAHETIERLALALLPPRIPSAAEMDALSSEAQHYDVYASIVLVRGSVAASDALEQRDRVVLGLREETSTVSASTRAEPWQRAMDDARTRDVDDSRMGTGVYDDRMIVLWKEPDGTRKVHVADWANTEPSAQYDAHSKAALHRDHPVFSSVTLRRGEGQDVNGDAVRDLGRLAEGTVEMQRATHPTPGGRGATHVALRPSVEAVRNGTGGVERDTNADGWFTTADIQGRQHLNNTFKIHQGSSGNTDSAGCQTVHPSQYPAFIKAVTANPHQTRWQYVLTSTTPSAGHDLQVGGVRTEDEGIGRVRAPPAVAARMPPVQQHVRQHPGLHTGDGQRSEPGLRHERRDQDPAPAPAPAPAPYRPDDPRHPDHRLLLQIRGIVRTLEGAGAPDGSADERLSRALLPVARGRGMSCVDHLMAHGGKLFMVQGRLHDPANLHACVDTEVAMRTGLEQSDRQLEEVHRRLGTERAQQQGAQQGQVQSNEALSLRV